MAKFDKFELPYSRKEHVCCYCNNQIPVKTSYLSRIFLEDEETGGKKKFLVYKYHLQCARFLDLTEKERKAVLMARIDSKNTSQNEIAQSINGMLGKFEREGKLTFLKAKARYNPGKQCRFGRPGFSDYVLFLNGGKTLFVEIKSYNGRQNNFQEKFEDKVKRLGFQYHIIRSSKELWYLLRQYIDI